MVLYVYHGFIRLYYTFKSYDFAELLKVPSGQIGSA
jgi:hypothetical protein